MKRAEVQIIRSGVPLGAFHKVTFFFSDVREFMLRLELALLEANRHGRVESFEVALPRE